jgi:hypothetical protein
MAIYLISIKKLILLKMWDFTVDSSAIFKKISKFQIKKSFAN